MDCTKLDWDTFTYRAECLRALEKSFKIGCNDIQIQKKDADNERKEIFGYIM